jgi:hypothetical protein
MGVVFGVLVLAAVLGVTVLAVLLALFLASLLPPPWSLG